MQMALITGLRWSTIRMAVETAKAARKKNANDSAVTVESGFQRIFDQMYAFFTENQTNFQ